MWMGIRFVDEYHFAEWGVGNVGSRGPGRRCAGDEVSHAPAREPLDGVDESVLHDVM
jgi:hypothetical protein